MPTLLFYDAKNVKNMKALKVILPCTISALIGCSHNSQSDYDTTTAALDSLFESRYDDPSAPGAGILIAKGDSIIYERYFGIANMNTGEKISDSTLFNIASVSKQFTVAALLQQPDINLDEPVSVYFDYPQDFWKKVSIAHLASHSSGIPDSRDRSDRDKCVFADEEASCAYFPYVDSLKFTPGSAYDYLNPSFILLAKIVEKKSGMDFYDYQQKNIFDKLGMFSTVYFNPQSMPSSAAHGYIPNENGGWVEYDYGEETFFATRPDGGIYSTPRDMLKWERGLAKGEVVTDSLLRLAYSPMIDVASSKFCDYQRRPFTSYGLGWFIDSTPGKPTKVYHTGDNGGFQAYVAKFPSEELSIIVLENRNDRDRWEMAQTIDSILFRE